ncbi:hypothetical protein QTP88_012626 [Uroleucon formosanum]
MEERPMCVLCSNTLLNDFMRPRKLSRHLITMHPEHQNKTPDFFERKASEQNSSMFTSLRDFFTVNELSMITSVSSVITDHSPSMLKFLSEYFPNLNKNNELDWLIFDNKDVCLCLLFLVLDMFDNYMAQLVFMENLKCISSLVNDYDLYVLMYMISTDIITN